MDYGFNDWLLILISNEIQKKSVIIINRASASVHEEKLIINKLSFFFLFHFFLIFFIFNLVAKFLVNVNAIDDASKS